MKRLLVFLFFPMVVSSQGLSKERVSRLKGSTVRITVKDTSAMGTGFFISELGDLITCWHVIQPALVFDSLGHLTSVRKILAKTNDGKSIEMEIPSAIFAKYNFTCTANDFCILTPKDFRFKTKDFLRVGNFDSIMEGDEIYTAGYPLGIESQFISKGILSTKYIDSSLIYTGTSKKFYRPLALLDITLNRGNSGGPIVRLGKTIDDDRVIGIADFLITKYGPMAQNMLKEFDEKKVEIKVRISDTLDVDLGRVLKMFAESITYMSNGISGCVSINHFLMMTK